MPNNPGYRVPRPPIGVSSYGEDDDATVRTSHYVARHGPPTVRTYRKNPRPPPNLPRKPPPNHTNVHNAQRHGGPSNTNNGPPITRPLQHPLPPPPLHKNGQPSSSRLDPTDSFRPPTGVKRHRDDGWPQRSSSKRPAPSIASPNPEEEYFNSSKSVAHDAPPHKPAKHGSRKRAEKQSEDDPARATPKAYEDMGKAKEDTQRIAIPPAPPPKRAATPPPPTAAPTRIEPSVDPSTEPSKPAKMKFRPVVPKKNRRMDTPTRSPGPFRPLPNNALQDEKQDIMIYDVPDDDDDDEEQVDERARIEGVVAIKRADIPIECWEGSSKSKEEARSLFRNKERAKLTAMGRKALAFLWRSDGLGIEWKLVNPPAPATAKKQEQEPPAKRARTEERQERPETHERAERTLTVKAPPVPPASSAPASSSASSSSPTQPSIPLANRPLAELQSEVVTKIEAIDRWTSMMEQLPSMATQLQRQIDRVQTEIFTLTEQMRAMKAPGK